MSEPMTSATARKCVKFNVCWGTMVKTTKTQLTRRFTLFVFPPSLWTVLWTRVGDSPTGGLRWHRAGAAVLP